MNKTTQRNIEQFEEELRCYWSHVKFPRDIIVVTTKAVNGHYVQREAETFTAIKLPHVKLTGYSYATHIRFIRMSSGATEMLRLDKVARITDIDGKDITPGAAKTSWKIKDYDITFDPASGKWNCTCLGFTYRRKCKHVEECKRDKR